MVVCSVEGCEREHSLESHKRMLQRAGVKSPNPPHRPPKWTQADLEFAEYLLDDGCSYREVTATTGIPRTTLSDKFPGRGWTPAQGRAFIAWVARDDKRQAMFLELYDEKRRVY